MEGRTPLHRAAEKGHGDAVKVLLRHGAFMYGSDAEGKTPLHLAAQNNHSHILKMFLKEEARSCRNQHNFLHMAALKDESSVAKMLLKAGASTDGKDEKGWTALSYAVSQGSENTAKVLLAAGASVDSNMVERAFNSNHPSIFKTLLEYSKDLSSDIMESALFRAGANFGIKTPASDTALHLAVQAGAASIVNLLLGNTDVAQQLLHHKAHVNVKDKHSLSLLPLRSSFSRLLLHPASPPTLLRAISGMSYSCTSSMSTNPLPSKQGYSCILSMLINPLPSFLYVCLLQYCSLS
uniref:Uncharacterized protein n=1 Tax=Falco tinnunculus TaxID=100819 RepID=A0A8C4V887_FALTI